MSIISTLEQEEPILVTAKELRRFDCIIKSIVPSEDTKSYYAYVEIRIRTATAIECLNGYISLNSDAIY